MPDPASTIRRSWCSRLPTTQPAPDLSATAGGGGAATIRGSRVPEGPAGAFPDRPGLQSVAMADNPMKSSFELAMERLRKKDADEGVVTRPLSDEDRAAIAEIRSFYDSKIAERDVLHQAA